MMKQEKRRGQKFRNLWQKRLILEIKENVLTERSRILETGNEVQDLK